MGKGQDSGRARTRSDSVIGHGRMTMGGFDERERRRIRQVACELRDTLGLDKLVTELGADRDDALWMTLMSVLKGAGQPSQKLAEGVARLKGLSVEALVSPEEAATVPTPAVDPY